MMYRLRKNLGGASSALGSRRTSFATAPRVPEGGEEMKKERERLTSAGHGRKNIGLEIKQSSSVPPAMNEKKEIDRFVK